MRADQATSAEITRAVAHVLTAASYRDAARLLQAELRRLPSIDVVIRDWVGSPDARFDPTVGTARPCVPPDAWCGPEFPRLSAPDVAGPSTDGVAHHVTDVAGIRSGV